MKVLYFITKSEQGGAQTHVAQLATYLTSRGHEVTIMSAPGGWLEQQAKKNNVKFYPNAFLGNTANPFRLLRSSSEFLKAVKEFQPDLVACHSTIAGLLGRFTLRNRIPTVFTAHGWAFTQGAPFYRRLFIKPLEKLAGLFCEKIICVSQNDLQLAQRLKIAPSNKLTVVYNGIDIPTLIPKKQSKDILDIFFVGRIALPKEPIKLIRAYLQLPKELQQRARLTIIGTGPQEGKLYDFVKKNSIQNKVTLTGSTPRKKVLELLDKQADLFVLISNWEGFPYTILEAMSFGIPVIASDIGGVREALQNKAGILIPKGNLDKLVNALSTLIQNRELREQMGEAGKKIAEQDFSVQIMCDKTMKVYESILFHKTHDS